MESVSTGTAFERNVFAGNVVNQIIAFAAVNQNIFFKTAPGMRFIMPAVADADGIIALAAEQCRVLQSVTAEVIIAVLTVDQNLNTALPTVAFIVRCKIVIDSIIAAAHFECGI